MWCTNDCLNCNDSSCELYIPRNEKITMNKEEIDKILKELENHDILSASEDTYLLDYIKTLQKENEKLSLIRNKALNWFVCPDINKLQNLLNILRGEE